MHNEKRSYCLLPRTSLHVLAVLGCLALASNVSKALTITPSFDDSITSASNAVEVENSVLTVVNVFEGLVADPINVTVFFTIGPTPENLLSQSAASLYAVPYDSYTSLLAQKAALTNNSILSTAVANLPVGNNGSLVVATSAALRALGVSAAMGLRGTDGVRGHGDLDGVVTLESGPDFQYSRPVSSDRFDARWAIAHEIDEILGVGGAGGSILNAAFDSGQSTPPFFGGVVGGEDLYRFGGPGIPSLTTSPDAIAYFSVDGGRTSLARFNQDPNFDYADWQFQFFCNPPVLLVQSGFCPGVAVDMSRDAPEAIALQAIGYNLQSVPEPATGLLFAGPGLFLLLLRRRLRQRCL